MQFKVLLFIVLALVVVAFSALNPQAVTVNLAFWSAPTVPLAAVIVASVAVGALIMALISLPRQVKQSMRVRDLTHRLEQAEGHLQREQTRANSLDQELEEFLAAQSQAAAFPEEPI